MDALPNTSQFRFTKLTPSLKGKTPEDIAVVLAFMERHGPNKQHQVCGFNCDHTPLSFAVAMESPVEMLAAILDAGADPNAYACMAYTWDRPAVRGGPVLMYAPLHYAAMNNNIEFATLLLNYGATPGLPCCPSVETRTALDIAMSDEMRELIQSYESPMAVPCAEAPE